MVSSFVFLICYSVFLIYIHICIRSSMFLCHLWIYDHSLSHGCGFIASLPDHHAETSLPWLCNLTVTNAETWRPVCDTGQWQNSWTGGFFSTPEWHFTSVGPPTGGFMRFTTFSERRNHVDLPKSDWAWQPFIFTHPEVAVQRLFVLQIFFFLQVIFAFSSWTGPHYHGNNTTWCLSL